MEAMNLQQLSLILDQDLVILPEDVQQHVIVQNQVPEVPLPAGPSPENAQEDVAEREYVEEINKLAYEGNFEKGILVVFQGNSLESSHREFLLKVLGAVGCSLKDVALVAATHILELPPESIDQLNPRKCLVFGSFNHPIMKFKTSDYETIGADREYFFADALEDLADNVQLKRNLWNGLQVLFQIKR
jgi:hypothetical protein